MTAIEEERIKEAKDQLQSSIEDAVNAFIENLKNITEGAPWSEDERESFNDFINEVEAAHATYVTTPQEETEVDDETEGDKTDG